MQPRQSSLKSLPASLLGLLLKHKRTSERRLPGLPPQSAPPRGSDQICFQQLSTGLTEDGLSRLLEGHASVQGCQGLAQSSEKSDLPRLVRETGRDETACRTKEALLWTLYVTMAKTQSDHVQEHGRAVPPEGSRLWNLDFVMQTAALKCKLKVMR